ncbi:hypothetical protein [Flavobacterium sp.]|uniref:hypothetical protein n=1 Tax=Flavobacterium sp. TaxID=239 RepID=UPI00374D4E61
MEEVQIYAFFREITKRKLLTKAINKPLALIRKKNKHIETQAIVLQKRAVENLDFFT